MEVTVPHNWEPRDYQWNLWNSLEAGIKRSVAVWHRRAGKDLLSLNWTVVQAFQRPGLYWHCLPTYKQGRKIVWDGMTKTGRKFLDYWPEQTVQRKRDDEMSVWLKNGSLWQVVGGDDVDRLVGANPVGVVFSEFSLCDPAVWNLIRPILAENEGWALFIYTARGRNHGYRMKQMAEKNPKWFFETLTVNDTGAIPLEAIQEDRDAGMPEELIQQEYFCSFDAPLVGSYYGDKMTWLAQNDRIGNVPWEPGMPVGTAWDLGIGDMTSIWFYQQIHKEIRLIDYYQATGEGFEHYAKILREKPYVYHEHLAPHDANVRELGTGKSRIEMARALGIQFRVVPKLALDDGINAVRALLPQCWIDEKNCEAGLDALREYKKEWDSAGEVFRNKPKHDWTSHPADAFRTLAVGIRPVRKRTSDRLAPQLAIV